MTSVVLFTIFHGFLTLIALGIFLFTLAMLISNFTNSIYVPSGTKTMREILAIVKPKRGSVFLDLGCGDGKVALWAAKTFDVEAIGIDVNPLLVAWARAKAMLFGVRAVHFSVKNAFKTDISNVDYIYVFLLPKFLEELTPKFDKEIKKGATVISHGFRIKNWDKNLVRTIPGKPFSTYLYKAPGA